MAQENRHGHWSLCHCCGKRTYHSRKDAREARRGVRQNGKARDKRPQDVLDIYPSCDGLGFHIGHTKARVLEPAKS